MPRSADILEPSRDSIADLNTCVLRNRRIPSSQNAPVSKRVKKGGAVVSNDGVQHSEQSTLKDMIGKPKLQRAVQPPEGWEEHMFGLRDRRCSLTPRPSITNTPMLPSPSLRLDDQIRDEDSAMEEVEENLDNNENEDDQPSSNENEDDQLSSSENEDDLLSGSEKEDDRLPGSNDDDKGSDYNENENDDEETESLSDSCDGDDAHARNAQTVSCAQSPLPPSLPPTYESDDSAHPVGDVVHPRQEGGPIYTRLQKKGKGRAIDAEDIDAANHSDRDTQLPNLKKPGNLSTAVLDEIRAFAKDVKTMAEELGRWHGRSTRDILVAAGFSVKASHTKINEANLFRLWYWAMQPKPDGADRNSINNLITKEYNTLMIGIPKDDFAARRERLKAVYEWSESSSTVPTNRSVKSIAARVDNAKTQFSGLVEAWSNLEDIEIVGAVMYVGQDPAGRQTSGIFGGSEMIRNFINENGIDVRSLMDKYTAIFKCLRNGDGADARVAGTGSIGDVGSALELRCRTKETPRDRNRRVFGSMMKEKMLAALRDLRVTRGIEVGDPQKVSWHWLLEFLRKSHLTIVNWPHGVSPPGPGFEYKKLKAGPLRQLVVPYLRRKLGHLYDGQTDDEEEQDSLDDVLEIEIKCWNEEVIDILDADPLKGEITLVKATDGTVLRQISDDPEWQKSLKETDCQQQGTERPCMEASNFDTIGPQDACPIAQDSHCDPSTIPSNVHTREPGPSEPPVLALQYGDLHRDNLPSRPHMREAGPAQQSFPRRQDSRGDRTNYRDPGPSNIPYHVLSSGHRNQFPLSCQGFHRFPSRTNHPYYNGPYTDDYYPPTQLGEPHWVNRGNAAQYEDDFAEEYINEDYY
ncbi:hypothetical protein M404DRAFT_28803 [Pisolithus tinctorius Marx 270]|uniref:Uncharacterized protein n=1 Tax=Pisolithus tinctorius Marx 270 TaxID=870435 RepID=A0A0C3P191_PISTI|nr:hypothetical protein M404DRAFT_28803 [Pisolithus tinctorius Marx 270]